MRATHRRRFPGGRKAVVYAVLVHVVLIALVVIGVRWQAKPVSPAAVIQAQAVNDAEMQKEIQRRKRDEAQRAAADAKRLRDQQERERQTAEAQRQKEQAALAEQQRKADAKRKAAEAEQKRKDAQRQAEAQRKKDVEAKRAADVQRKKDAEVRRQAAEKGLQEQLASEEKERADAQAKAQQQARAQSELARYQALIKQRIENSWVIPGGWTKNMECLVHVRLIPTGEVIEATVVRSSGNTAFDRSAENAVYKASPLPLPEDKALFEHFRDFNFDFTPQERS